MTPSQVLKDALSRIPEDIDQIATDIVRADYSDAAEPDYAMYRAIAEAINAERQKGETAAEISVANLRDILEEARAYIRMTSNFKAKDVEWRMVRRIDYVLHATGDWKVFPVTAEVPIDPTDGMIKAAMSVDLGNEDEKGAIINVWHAMVHAAHASPSPTPSPQESAIRAAEER